MSLIVAATAAAKFARPRVTGYQISRSLRFNSADSAYLNRTIGAPTDADKFTISLWAKRSALGSGQDLWSAGPTPGTNDFDELYFNGDDKLDFLIYYSSAAQARIISSAVFRDLSAWYHIVLAVDIQNATANDRLIMYVNNVRQTLSTNTTPSTAVIPRSGVSGNIGRIAQYMGSGQGNFFNGYITEYYFIDGQALTPTSFGETNETTGVWSPIRYAGSYGTNGFYLNFSDNSGVTSTTLGKDQAGSNNWTPSGSPGFSVTAGAGNDSLVDTPTQYGTDTGAGGQVRGNYATFNPLKSNSTTTTFSNGNLVASYPSGAAGGVAMATMAVSSGKWYWEVLIGGTDGSTQPKLGVLSPSVLTETSASTDVAVDGYSYSRNGQKSILQTVSAYGSAFTTNDVIGFALDMDAGTLTCYLNNVSQGTLASGLTGSLAPAMTGYNPGTAITLTANFGQRPFAYTAPSGFKALVTTNLPEPTVVQGDDYFNTVLYEGDGSNPRGITGVGFQPDFVWLKNRSAGWGNRLSNAVVGANYALETNSTNAELFQNQYGYLNSFNSDGFTVTAGSTDDYFTNNSGDNYVAWNWKADGAGSLNEAGTISSTVSVSTTSGFSIVTYTGNGTAGATIGHGLGVAPSMVIVKNRSRAMNWWVYGSAVTSDNNYGLLLNTTDALQNQGGYGHNNTYPTSTVFYGGIGGSTSLSYSNYSGDTYVAYCFAEVEGFSKFGSYTGNGSADGPFIFTGFRPAFVMVKSSSNAYQWSIHDTARQTFNEDERILAPNSSSAEDTNAAYGVDILSNGFKWRNSGEAFNFSGYTYIYMAFATSPFKYSLAR